MFFALGLLLPFLTGQIPQIGNMLLPMHLPVFLCALICGWQYALPMAAALPLLRSLMFGMPPIYPTAVAMAFELATYAFVTGFIYNILEKHNLLKKMPRIIDLIKWEDEKKESELKDNLCYEQNKDSLIPINKRKIGVSILLSIITLGIYKIYWIYLLVKNIKSIQKNNSNCTREMLCIVFVPFYSLYWWYTKGKIVKDKFVDHKYSAAGNEIVYLILGIFCLSIVSMSIMQNDFNSLVTENTQTTQRNDDLLKVYISLISGMLAGRIVWGIAQLILLGIKGNTFTFSAFISGAFLTAFPGIILQLLLIPGIMLALDKMKLVKFKRE